MPEIAALREIVAVLRQANVSLRRLS